MCEVIWDAFGGRIERYPADWDLYGKRAGYVRNTFMAELPGIYKCLAFQLDGSDGTQHCMDECHARKIPVSPFIMWSNNGS